MRAGHGPALAIAEAEAQRSLKADEREHELLGWKSEQDARDHELALRRMDVDAAIAEVRARVVVRLAIVAAVTLGVLLPLSWWIH